MVGCNTVCRREDRSGESNKVYYVMRGQHAFVVVSLPPWPRL